MKTAWFILLVSAFTDGGVVAWAGYGALLAADSAMPEGKKLVWTWTVIAAPAVGGVYAMFRTVQQALKATPASTAALMGQPVTTVTETPTATIKSTPTETVVATPARKRKPAP